MRIMIYEHQGNLCVLKNKYTSYSKIHFYLDVFNLNLQIAHNLHQLQPPIYWE